MDHRTQFELLNRLRGVRVLVVGDVMLDHYRVGQATRISPEAPVPVLLNPCDEFRLGGAGAVAAMCAALRADVRLAGIIGEDSGGRQVSRLLDEAGVRFLGEQSAQRVTTTKERICGVSGGRHRQQLGRIDCEDDGPLPRDCMYSLCRTIDGLAADPPDVVLVTDYAKGVVSPEVAEVCHELCDLSIADPPRAGDWLKYQYFGCIVPNREEAGERSAEQIRSTLRTRAAIVKLDQDGCRLNSAERSGATVTIAAKARAVHDVTGAGDQFLAVLGCVKAIGGSWLEAAELANLAAGLQVERLGCVPVTIDELMHEIGLGKLKAAG